jgi:hypothetical protein
MKTLSSDVFTLLARDTETNQHHEHDPESATICAWRYTFRTTEHASETSGTTISLSLSNGIAPTRLHPIGSSSLHDSFSEEYSCPSV